MEGCEYCKDQCNKPFYEHIDSEMFIRNNKLVHADIVEGFYLEDETKIEFCPKCGRKLNK